VMGRFIGSILSGHVLMLLENSLWRVTVAVHIAEAWYIKYYSKNDKNASPSIEVQASSGTKPWQLWEYATYKTCQQYLEEYELDFYLDFRVL
jgi:hypothetical protein